jgi:acyl carrier protein
MDRSEELQELVLDTLCDACNADRTTVDLHTDVADIGFDSLTVTALLAQVQAFYNVEIAGPHIVGLHDSILVSDLVTKLSKAIAESADTSPS